MGLTYKILWVDDQIDGLIDLGLKDNLETYLTELGFIPTIKCFEDTESAREELEATKYDLILSDFNIDDGENGDVLITKIRDGDIFTEVLFYSAQPNFSSVIQNLSVDRVSLLSIAGQVPYSRIEQKAKWLIDQTIVKLQEIESLRGLVMSETSHLDSMVEDILTAYFHSDSPNIRKLKKIVLSKIKNSARSNLRKAEKLAEESDLNIIKSRLFDASKKARSLKDLIKIEAVQHEQQFDDFFESYKHDVLDIRNKLAHAKAQTNNGQEYLIIDNENQEVFDQQKVVQIRKNLLRYKQFLKGLKTNVDAGAIVKSDI